MTKNGTIYLVGTGPGDLGLITVKGLALLKEADAIVGDLLSHARLLQEARPEAERHDVGCRTSHSKIPQREVNQRLVTLAQQGKMVVRLWPGDPFIYGRATQEILAAKQAGLRVQVVPGVTSALAAPAYAGVPLTDWEHTTSFAVVTGYESKNPTVRPDWEALARVETLVILMPLDDLPQIVDRLLTAGRPGNTPAIAIQHGTLPQQKQVATTLESLAEVVHNHHLQPPTLVVVGAVAGLAPELAWFKNDEELPLLGKRVLVTRPAQQAAEFMAALRDQGADPISFPTIEIQPVADTLPLDEAIQKIGRLSQGEAETANRKSKPCTEPSRSIENRKFPYDWLIFTSANGVAAFWERLQANGLDSRALSLLKIAAIGPATAAALAQRSISPDLVPEVYTAEGVLAAFEQYPLGFESFLLARADIARKTLAEGLAARGAIVEEIAAYRTVPRSTGPLPPAADIVTFTSSSTVQGYVNCLGGRRPAEVLQQSQVVCIGPVTAATAQELGVPVHAVAKAYTIEGILKILEER